MLELDEIWNKIKWKIHACSTMQFKACICYFSLFLQECISSLLRTKYIEKKFNLQLLFLPTVSQTFILSWATNATRPCKFLFRKNNSMCLIETMLKPLPLVQNKARTEVNQTNPVQTNISIVKGLETSIIHVIEYQIEWDIFLKNIFWSKHFPATTNCKSLHSLVFLVKPVLKIS